MAAVYGVAVPADAAELRRMVYRAQRPFRLGVLVYALGVLAGPLWALAAVFAGDWTVALARLVVAFVLLLVAAAPLMVVSDWCDARQDRMLG
jgi:cation transport ATPase